MASNKQLRASIDALVIALALSPEDLMGVMEGAALEGALDDLTNEGLNTLNKALKRESAVRDITELCEQLEIQAPEMDEMDLTTLSKTLTDLKKATEPAKTAPEFAYSVAEGKSLTTMSRGILGSGAEIKPADVPRGKEQLEELAAKGYVKKAGS